MSSLPALQLATATLALSGTAVALVQPKRSVVIATWAVFCISMFFFMLRKIAGGDLGVLGPIIAMAGAATCGWFWLFSRALFRAERAVELRHVMVVCSISALILIYQALVQAEPEGARTLVSGTVINAVTMISSTVLFLAFYEAIRDWTPELPEAERRFRIAFACFYAGAVVISVLIAQSGDAVLSLQAKELIRAGCALAAVIASGAAVWYRLGHPLPQTSQPERRGSRSERARAVVEGPSGEEDAVLAQAIVRKVRDQQMFLTHNLKVSDLAERLGEPEYKISRCLTGVLGYRNFNQYINQFRIEHAKRLLADPDCDARSILSIGMDSGFSSIGPFNRAFKVIVGMTPRQYRADAQNSRANRS